MSTSANEVMEQDGNVIQHEIFPEWLGCFLEKTFFNKCPEHHDLQKNEVNRYCVTCGASSCRYCIADGQHDEHKILTIYRHVYQDVVPLNEMENHINCEKIQPYKCNKKWVVSLTPLPHNGSGSLIEGDGACIVCKQKLMDPNRFCFCSITCKVHALLERSGTIQPPRPVVGTSQERDGVEQRNDPKSDKRNRKGVPHRSPLF